MKLHVVFQATLCVGALLAVVGGAAIGIGTMIDPQMEILPRIERGYRHIVFGFLFLTLFAVASTLLDALFRAARPPAAPAPEPAPAPAAATPVEAKPEKPAS